MTIKLKDYDRRDDLCAPHQTALYYLKDYGSLIRVHGQGWFCTNDSRISLVGLLENNRLAQPTLGPFKTAQLAHEARENSRP